MWLTSYNYYVNTKLLSMYNNNQLQKLILMELVNIVATVEMSKPFDLEELLVKLPNVEKAHFWVKAKIPPYNKYTAFMVQESS